MLQKIANTYCVDKENQCSKVSISLLKIQRSYRFCEAYCAFCAYCAYCGKRNLMLQSFYFTPQNSFLWGGSMHIVAKEIQCSKLYFFNVAYCGKKIPNLQSLFFNELRIVAQTKNYQRSEACLSLLRTVAKKWSTLQSLFINAAGHWGNTKKVQSFYLFCEAD